VVVLSIELGHRDESRRLRVSPRHWIHHLEVRAVAELDDEVGVWLREATERAG